MTVIDKLGRGLHIVVVQLNFKVTRPKLASADGSSGVLEIGQWTECVVNITFTGGFKCAGVPDKQSVPVTLRAFVVV